MEIGDRGIDRADTGRIAGTSASGDPGRYGGPPVIT